MHPSSLAKILPIFSLLIITASELNASALKDDGRQDGVNGKKELTKRGTSGGVPNDYGPAIKITSSVLQLTKPAEGSTAVGDIGLQHHETTLEHPWLAGFGYALPVAHSIWLDWPAIQRDFHLLPMSVNNEADFLEPHDEAASPVDVGGSMPESSTQFSKGLHTQVISSSSSSSKDVPHVSDNLDFGEASESQGKENYRSSYGR